MQHALRSSGILGISLFVLASAFFVAVPQAQAANNVSTGIVLQDTNANGKVDRIVLSVDNDALETWVVNGTPGFAITQGGEALTVSSTNVSGSATADPVIVNVNLNEATVDVDTDGVSANAVEVVYTQSGGGAACTNCVRDTSGELTAIVTADGGGAANTEVDAMAPRIASQSPASGGGASRNSNIVIVFSEPINIATDDIDVNPVAAGTESWTVNNTTFTLDPTSILPVGTNTVTITTAADVAAAPNAFGGAISGTTTHPWSFTVNSSSTSNSIPLDTTPVTYDIDITVPSIVEEWPAGMKMPITWVSDGGSAMSAVNLYYSIDSGKTYVQIAKNLPNNGKHSWTLPAVDTNDAYIKIEGTDLVEVLATDISSQFKISTGVVDEEDDEEVPVDEDEDEDMEDGMGISPVTGELEAITEVAVGDYIMSEYFDTVYYVDAGMVRRPFVDAQTYFTYEDSFNEVKMVTDATLPTLTLGSPMLPKAGVVLIKIQSDNHVYAVVNDGQGHMELRWISSEAIAKELYGADWADYVIDIPVTLFGKYMMGEEVTTADELEVNMMNMKTRLEVNS